MRGKFRAWPGTSHEQALPNTVLDEGEDTFIKMIFQGDASVVASGGNYFIGLCGNTFVEADTLATLAGEPAVASGYARQPVSRDSTGWPTIDSVNGVRRISSKQVTFVGSGGPFSTSIRRAFLTTVVSGTSGKLLAISAPLSADKLIVSGESFPIAYESYIN